MTSQASIRRDEARAPAAPLALDALKGLRAMIINCPLREDALPNCAPLGPALLGARLLQHGADARIVDLNAYRVPALDKPAGRHLTLAEAVGLIRRTAQKHGAPHLIGLGGMITTLRWQRDLARALRREFPDALLVSGAGLATEFREGLFNWIPELDGIVHSEADDIILTVGINALFSAKMGRSAFKRAGLERTVYAGDRPADLDVLPLPAWDLLLEDVDGVRILETYIKNEIWGVKANNSSATPFLMTRSLNTVSSRGCPHACNFCFKGAQGERQYGVRSAACITHEVTWLHSRFNINWVGFLDDNFMIRADRIEDMIPTLGVFCREKGVRWGTHGRLDEAADLRPDGKGGNVGAARRRVDAMAEAGCVYIGFGAESANPRVLNAMKKGGFMNANGTTKINGRDLPQTMITGYSNVIKAGIHGNCTWIKGHISEDLNALKDSVAFVLWQRGLIGKSESVNSRFFTSTYYPGTEMGRHPKVQMRLAEGFDINFGADGNPICDDALLEYVLQLDDADKVLVDKKGNDVFYSDMTAAQFKQCSELIDAGDLEGVMRL